MTTPLLVRAATAASLRASDAAARSSISAITDAARSSSICSSSAVQTRGMRSIAQSDPTVAPFGSVSGTPAYATTPRSRTAKFSRTRGWTRASSMTRAVPSVTTCWQNECESGV